MAIAGPWVGCDSKTYHTFYIENETYIKKRMETYNQKNPSTSFWLNRVIDTVPFVKGMGYEMRKFVFHPAPAPQYDTNDLWGTYGPSVAGTPDLDPSDPNYVEPVDACSTECMEVDYGMQEKRWSLRKLCLASKWMCAHDIQSKYHLKQTLDAQALNLRRISNTVKANWNRDHTTSFSAIVPGFKDWKSVIDFSGPRGVLPKIPEGDFGKADLGYMDAMYDTLSLQYNDAAIGYDNGMPVFGVVGNRDTIFGMRANNAKLWESDKYGSPNFYKDGFKTEYYFHGFSYYFDPEHPRYIEDPLRPGYLKRIFPYVSRATTLGLRWDCFPGGSWDTAAYDQLTFMFRDQFQNVPFTLDTAPGGSVKWDEVDYAGKVEWQKYAKDCDDEDGLRGRYRMKWIMGVEPGDHDAGLAFIFKRCDPCINHGCSAGAVSCVAEDDPYTELVCASVDGESTQLSLTPTATIGGGALGADDEVWVKFASGEWALALVVSGNGTSGAALVLDFEFDIDCDYEGGAVSLTVTPPEWGVELLAVGPIAGGSNTVFKLRLLPGVVLPDVTIGARYDLRAGDDTTAKPSGGDYTATPVLLSAPDADGVFTVNAAANLIAQFPTGDLDAHGGIVAVIHPTA